MVELRIGTFNLENLFLRYKILDKERGSKQPKPVDPDNFVENGGHINLLGMTINDFGPISKSLRKETARIILDNAPDILAVQEVESQEALFQFNRKYFGKNAYPYYLVVDGNDQRQIDVGFLSRWPILQIMTHQFLPEGTADRRKKTFSRDCLGVTFDVNGKELTIFNNHLTSRISDPDGTGRREPQSKAIIDIIKASFPKPERANWVICGDFNALPDETPVTWIEKQIAAENVVNRLPEDDRWTYIYKGARQQLDYILASRALAARSKALPVLDHSGQPAKKGKYDPQKKGYDLADGASDHSALFWDIKL
jgi:predicted extracellular nuclease